MCVPDLSVLKSVVLGDKQYNLGAIVPGRLHNNGLIGDLFGGIYGTRVANFLEIPIHENDIELPPPYLDNNAMVRHQFVERNDQSLQYRLIFVSLVLALLWSSYALASLLCPAQCGRGCSFDFPCTSKGGKWRSPTFVH